MRQALTPRQVAQAIGVSEASLKRWCDKGLLPSQRTGGGHRRLNLPGVVSFLRQSGHPLVRPEVLGLPTNTGCLEGNVERARALMLEALRGGDEDQVARIVFDLYLSSTSVVDICDKVLARSFHEIGHKWENGELQVYEERRAGEMCLRTLHRLRNVIPAPPEDAPTAIGAALESDPYVLPTAMVDVVLREEGWRAESYGIGHPIETACTAIDRVAPRVFWLSVSSIADVEAFLSGYEQIYRTAIARGVSVVVGGRALTESIRDRMAFAAHCDNLAHLVSFVRSLKGQPKPAESGPSAT